MRVSLGLGILGYLFWWFFWWWAIIAIPFAGLFGLVLLLPVLGAIGGAVGGRVGGLLMLVGVAGQAFIELSFRGLENGAPPTPYVFSPWNLVGALPAIVWVVGAIFAFRERKAPTNPSGSS